MAVQQFTIGHTGTVLDPNDDIGAVTLEENQTAPQRETPVASFTCPDNFDSISFVGNRDATRFVPRTKETATGDGNTTTYGVESDLVPVTGEPLLEDQPYPVVVAVVAGAEVDVESVDYAADEVTLAEAPAADAAISLFPIITEGVVKIRGLNTLDQPTGPIYPWGFPLYRWHDLPQDKRGTEINLNGSISWQRNETMQVLVDSPQTVVWEDDDYPEAFVSSLEIDTEITH